MFNMLFLLFIPVLLFCGQLTTVKGDCNRKLGNSGHDHLPRRKDFPAFTAYRSSPQSLSVNEVIKLFDKVWTNNGNGYDPSSGVFTAKLAGLYHFAAVVVSTSGGTLFVRLFHNNTNISASFITEKGYKYGTFDVVLSLEKGDKVSIKIRS
ncbi:C1QL [Mytilus coruscus]|uniref:C1QL n=1 Tax=Mytilus coruscus TaxID=42192 RepID=A0A6J8EVX6_MYTCO|nr:C1QL [Mytilus coruscus]